MFLLTVSGCETVAKGIHRGVGAGLDHARVVRLQRHTVKTGITHHQLSSGVVMLLGLVVEPATHVELLARVEGLSLHALRVEHISELELLFMRKVPVMARLL